MNESSQNKPCRADPAPEETLRCEKVGKVYAAGGGRVAVLDGLDLAVSRGQSVAVMGASGAGKTTLLHILGGLDKPTSGKVFWRGRDLYAASNAERSRIRSAEIGFVFQSYYLLPELDVLENVMLPAMSLRGRGARHMAIRSGAETRAAELLRAVGLSHRTGHLPAELSGGEQQRAALARALMNDPAIVMADEPTGNLDPATGGQILDLLFDMANRGGKTLLVVTHNADVAARCGAVARLEQGRLSFPG